MTKEGFPVFQRSCCPTCGAFQYMGTTVLFHGPMQVMVETLGLALSWSAPIPATHAEMKRAARLAGQQIMLLAGPI